SETGLPWTVTPATLPTPFRADTEVAVTAPPKSDTVRTDTAPGRQLEPKASASPNVMTVPAAGYADAPRRDGTAPTVSGVRPGRTIAAAPAEAQCGRAVI